jgi:hypothetical protein
MNEQVLRFVMIWHILSEGRVRSGQWELQSNEGPVPHVTGRRGCLDDINILWEHIGFVGSVLRHIHFHLA